MRIIARFTKGESVRFISHLDVQRTFQRAFRRAGLPLAYSQGFNPHPLLSFASALSVGHMSEAEWFDVKLDRDVSPEDFTLSLNRVLPSGFSIAKAIAAPDSLASLTALMESAHYTFVFSGPGASALHLAMPALLSGALVVEKRSKGGLKNVDLMPLIKSCEYCFCDGELKVSLLGALTASGGFNAELFSSALMEKAGERLSASICRDAIFFTGGASVPPMEQAQF